jgi:DNA-binding MarR family transcriptional regulator
METKADASRDRYEALLQLLRTADLVWNTSRAFFARWDLGPSQFNVLNLLHLNPEGLSQTELSRELIMHRSNVTGLVDRLEKRGLLKRREVASDRRAYQVVLTPAGARLVRDILPHYHQKADEVWKQISAKRVAAFVGDLEVVSHNVARVAEELTSPPKLGR